MGHFGVHVRDHTFRSICDAYYEQPHLLCWVDELRHDFVEHGLDMFEWIAVPVDEVVLCGDFEVGTDDAVLWTRHPGLLRHALVEIVRVEELAGVEDDETWDVEVRVHCS